MNHNYAMNGRLIAKTTRRNHRAWRFGLLTSLVLSLTALAVAQRPAVESKAQQDGMSQIQGQLQGNSYETIYYKSGDLNIEAYFYKPQGKGPFPLVIYNHGSRAGSERVERPMQFIAAILVPQGYAVLVPERREVGSDRGDLMMKRFREEAGDVLAALEYLKRKESATNLGRVKPAATLIPIDFKRVALMGFSQGGTVSLLAASAQREFVALVNQAGGSLTWNSSPTLQRELPAAGRKIKVPALCMDAENDATTNAVKTVGEAIKSSGEWEKTIIYPPFTPTSNPNNIAPGHLIFAQGVSIWQDDLLTFLRTRFGIR
jgi:dienelactone hydrolase